MTEMVRQGTDFRTSLQYGKHLPEILKRNLLQLKIIHFQEHFASSDTIQNPFDWRTSQCHNYLLTPYNVISYVRDRPSNVTPEIIGSILDVVTL